MSDWRRALSREVDVVNDCTRRCFRSSDFTSLCAQSAGFLHVPVAQTPQSAQETSATFNRPAGQSDVSRLLRSHAFSAQYVTLEVSPFTPAHSRSEIFMAMVGAKPSDACNRLAQSGSDKAIE
jgi:hypothetical protein